ncbi:unnamed protein product [Dimorphilus gyrociliatus]|uniref:RING-type domain-containing protein n=1 Tax=Dimorphilus gyrociliatus TaxID=2664684 RepID=A0A7I8VFF2_9ANNE|nr:unnamed protein product [Dimorphilus gyrociliatus]
MAKKWLRIEEDNLKCVICQKLGIDKDPRLLSCGDTFCSSCLQNFANSNECDNLFTCPKCKEDIKWPENGIDGIPKNNLFQYLEQVDSKTDWSGFKNESNMIKFWNESEGNIIKDVKNGIEELSDNIHNKEQELLKSIQETYKSFKRKWRENQAYLHSLTLTPIDFEGDGEKLFEEVLWNNYKLEHTQITFTYELNLNPKFYLLRSMEEGTPMNITSCNETKRAVDQDNCIIYEDDLIYEKNKNELFEYSCKESGSSITKIPLKSSNALFAVHKGVIYQIYWRESGKNTSVRKDSGIETSRFQNLLSSVAQDASQLLNRKNSKKDGTTQSIGEHTSSDRISIEKYVRKEWRKIGEIQQDQSTNGKSALFAIGPKVLIVVEAGKVYCFPIDSDDGESKKWEIAIKHNYDRVIYIQIIVDCIYLILEKGEENIKDNFLLKYSTSGCLLLMHRLKLENFNYRNCFILPSENIILLKEKTVKIISPFGKELDEKRLENLTGKFDNPVWLKVIWTLKEVYIYGVFKHNDTSFIGLMKLYG